VKQYLEAEILFLLDRLELGDVVLELGCGYGRVTRRLAGSACRVIGIDTSAESLALARELQDPDSPCQFVQMDALELAFGDGAFDKVVCVQNGICAFGVDQQALLRQALRVTRRGGRALFSTYSPRFWAERLRWFEAQAAAGLIGAIDYDRTGNDTISCKDGFSTGILSPEAWRSLSEGLGVDSTITEIDESSVWFEVVGQEAA